MNELECGRCGRPLSLNKLHALSRKDNKTTICNDCGTHEALEDLYCEALEDLFRKDESK